MATRKDTIIIDAYTIYDIQYTHYRDISYPKYNFDIRKIICVRNNQYFEKRC